MDASEHLITQVADALADHFKATIAASAGKPFGSTGVSLPARAIWEGKARAALAAMPQPQPEAAQVRDLEWHECPTHGGRMLISFSLGEQWRVRPAGSGEAERQREEREKAKANAEHKARILSVLATPPRDERDAEIERLKAKLETAVKALKHIRKQWPDDFAARHARAALAEIKAGDA